MEQFTSQNMKNNRAWASNQGNLTVRCDTSRGRQLNREIIRKREPQKALVKLSRVTMCTPKAGPSEGWHPRLHTLGEIEPMRIVPPNHSTNKQANNNLGREQGKGSLFLVAIIHYPKWQFFNKKHTRHVNKQERMTHTQESKRQKYPLRGHRNWT